MQYISTSLDNPFLPDAADADVVMAVCFLVVTHFYSFRTRPPANSSVSFSFLPALPLLFQALGFLLYGALLYLECQSLLNAAGSFVFWILGNFAFVSTSASLPSPPSLPPSLPPSPPASSEKKDQTISPATIPRTNNSNIYSPFSTPQKGKSQNEVISVSTNGEIRKPTANSSRSDSVTEDAKVPLLDTDLAQQPKQPPNPMRKARSFFRCCLNFL
jgi:hypothetical protein